MKAIDVDNINDGEGLIYKGNGISFRINDKAFKCTLNYKHASEEKKNEVRALINEKIFELVKELMFVEK